MAEAVATLSPQVVLHLELPCRAVVFEQMTLPSTDPTELLDMARLQLEKSLPFTPEEISSDIQVIARQETESRLLAVAINHELLDEICEPLRARKLYPKAVTVRALQEAKACPPDETVLLVYREGESTVIAFVEQAHLLHTTTIEGATDTAAVMAELPQVLMSAEMDGVPSEFTRIVASAECGELRESLGEFFKRPVEILASSPAVAQPVVNLVPEPWLADIRQQDRKSQFKQRLATAGMIYIALVVGACAYLISLDMRTRSLAKKVALSQPLVVELQAEQSRWQALAPAVEPRLYTVELLNQITQSIPSEDLKITEFTQDPRQLALKAEASSANSAIDFGERLKSNTALNQFHFNMAPPTILANNRAQVSIFGKL